MTKADKLTRIETSQLASNRYLSSAPATRAEATSKSRRWFFRNRMFICITCLIIGCPPCSMDLFVVRVNFEQAIKCGLISVQTILSSISRLT